MALATLPKAAARCEALKREQRINPCNQFSVLERGSMKRGDSGLERTVSLAARCSQVCMAAVAVVAGQRRAVQGNSEGQPFARADPLRQAP